MTRCRGKRRELPETTGDGLSAADRDLVLALVDGSLPETRRAALEAELLEVPGGRRALERQRRVVLQTRAGVKAPARLRAGVEARRIRPGALARFAAPLSMLALVAALLLVARPF